MQIRDSDILTTKRYLHVTAKLDTTSNFYQLPVPQLVDTRGLYGFTKTAMVPIDCSSLLLLIKTTIQLEHRWAATHFWEGFRWQENLPLNLSIPDMQVYHGFEAYNFPNNANLETWDCPKFWGTCSIFFRHMALVINHWQFSNVTETACLICLSCP
jgi:hypothetical protein